MQRGEVDFAFFNISTVQEGVHVGALRALAVTSAERSPFLPEVPTMQEAGIAGHEMSTWIGVSTAAGTPAPIVRRTYEASRDMMAAPEVRRRVTQMGFDLMTQTTPEETMALHRAEFEKWGPTLQTADLRME